MELYVFSLVSNGMLVDLTSSSLRIPAVSTTNDGKHLQYEEDGKEQTLGKNK